MTKQQIQKSAQEIYTEYQKAKEKEETQSKLLEIAKIKELEKEIQNINLKPSGQYINDRGFYHQDIVSEDKSISLKINCNLIGFFLCYGFMIFLIILSILNFNNIMDNQQTLIDNQLILNDKLVLINNNINNTNANIILSQDWIIKNLKK